MRLARRLKLEDHALIFTKRQSVCLLLVTRGDQLHALKSFHLLPSQRCISTTVILDELKHHTVLALAQGSFKRVLFACPSRAGSVSAVQRLV